MKLGWKFLLIATAFVPYLICWLNIDDEPRLNYKVTTSSCLTLLPSFGPLPVRRKTLQLKPSQLVMLWRLKFEFVLHTSIYLFIVILLVENYRDYDHLLSKYTGNSSTDFEVDNCLLTLIPCHFQFFHICSEGILHHRIKKLH